MPRDYINGDGRRKVIDREKVIKLLRQGVEVCAIAERLGANRRHLNSIVKQIRDATNSPKG